jgi:ABC-2 type transport system permease protein
VGLVQFGTVAAAALIVMALSDDSSLPTTTPGTIGWVVFWFVLGYSFNAVSLWATGSPVSRQEEAQSMTFPVSALLIAAYILALESAQSPDSRWR